MRLLLVSATTEKIPDPVHPGSAAAGAAVRRAGRWFEAVDPCVAEAVRSAGVVCGRGMRTDIEMPKKLRDKKIEDEPWRSLRG